MLILLMIMIMIMITMHVFHINVTTCHSMLSTIHNLHDEPCIEFHGHNNPRAARAAAEFRRRKKEAKDIQDKLQRKKGHVKKKPKIVPKTHKKGARYMV
jgi:hypothetical protein